MHGLLFFVKHLGKTMFCNSSTKKPLFSYSILLFIYLLFIIIHYEDKYINHAWTKGKKMIRDIKMVSSFHFWTSNVRCPYHFSWSLAVTFCWIIKLLQNKTAMKMSTSSLRNTQYKTLLIINISPLLNKINKIALIPESH